MLVAQRSRTCRICKGLEPAQIADVNAVIWPEPGVAVRARDYRIAAVRAARANGLEVEEKSVTRHATHVERSWHKVDAGRPASPGELPVFPTDYTSMVGQAAQLGAVAISQLTKRAKSGQMEDRELVAAARIGMTSVQHREALRMRAQEVDTAHALLAAIHGLGGGHISEDDVPETEVIDVTPVEVLHEKVRSEREALKRLQAGEAPGGG